MTRSLRARCFALALAITGSAGLAAADKPAEKPAKPAPAPAKPAPAAAKPTEAQALTTAQAWLDAMQEARPNAAPLTASTLYAVAYTAASTACEETTASEPAQRGALLGCLEEQVKGAGKLKPWKKGSEKGFGPLVKKLKAKLPALERNATVVYMHEKCVGEGRDLVIAVTLEKDKPRVSAVLSSHWVCGE